MVGISSARARLVSDLRMCGKVQCSGNLSLHCKSCIHCAEYCQMVTGYIKNNEAFMKFSLSS